MEEDRPVAELVQDVHVCPVEISVSGYVDGLFALVKVQHVGLVHLEAVGQEVGTCSRRPPAKSFHTMRTVAWKASQSSGTLCNAKDGAWRMPLQLQSWQENQDLCCGDRPKYDRPSPGQPHSRVSDQIDVDATETSLKLWLVEAHDAC